MGIKNLTGLKHFIKKQKYILNGLATYLPKSLGRFISNNHSQFEGKGVRRASVKTRECYSIWMRILVSLHKNGINLEDIESVGEIGPGDSLGVGLAALISGSENYYGLDIVETAFRSNNLEMFDSLVELYKKREPIPDDDEYPKIKLKLDDYSFPHYILTDEVMEKNLSPDRIVKFRNNIIDLERSKRNNEKDNIQYIVPFYEANNVKNLDLIISNAVMEHVESITLIYNLCNKWLKNEKYMVHIIDYKSHGLAWSWNGHWTYSSWLWEIIKGRNVYSINRNSFSEHMNAQKNNNFSTVYKEEYEKESSIKYKNIARDLKGKVTEKDFSIAESFTISQVKK